jgi:hypothetical protein
MYSKCLEDLVNAITIWIPGRRFAGTCNYVSKLATRNGNAWTTITTLHKNAASKFHKFFLLAVKKCQLSQLKQKHTQSQCPLPILMFTCLCAVTSPSFQTLTAYFSNTIDLCLSFIITHASNITRHFISAPPLKIAMSSYSESIDVFSKLHNLTVCISSRVHGGLKAETWVPGLDLATADRAQRDKR